MLTDFHTHIFPDKMADKTIKLLESNIKEEYRPHKSELRCTLDALKQSMRENNVDISLVLPIATNVKQSTTINNFAASINGIDGIYSLGILHPMQSDWESVLYDIKEKGLKGSQEREKAFREYSEQADRYLYLCPNEVRL